MLQLVVGHSVYALDYVHSCGRNINDRWNIHANTSKTQLVTTEMVFHGISWYFHNLCPSEHGCRHLVCSVIIIIDGDMANQ